MSKLVRGDQLPSSLRRQVLARYVHRWTRDNPQREHAYRGHEGKPTIPLVSDEQWLREHAFYVTDRGTLDARRKHAEPAYMIEDKSSTKEHHATKKKSPAQLEREIAEALSKSGKGSRPSKLGGDYFTVVLTRAKPAATNEWNQLPTGWNSQTRGTFPSKHAAFKWAREKLLPGAPFTIRYVPLGEA